MRFSLTATACLLLSLAADQSAAQAQQVVYSIAGTSSRQIVPVPAPAMGPAVPALGAEPFQNRPVSNTGVNVTAGGNTAQINCANPEDCLAQCSTDNIFQPTSGGNQLTEGNVATLVGEGPWAQLDLLGATQHAVLLVLAILSQL